MTDRDYEQLFAAINKLSDKFDAMIASGCTVGKINSIKIETIERELEAIKGLMRKAVAFGLLLATGSAGSVKLIEWWLQ